LAAIDTSFFLLEIKLSGLVYAVFLTADFRHRI
jgi:hypothetical protein